MGNLIVKKVIYSGENYFFESPELSKGINIIVGDNGSGKSTLSYFIEFGLGGNVKPFKKEVNNSKKNNENYTEILDDENNYVNLTISINDEEYKIKRFIGRNDVFVKENEKVLKLPIYRDKKYAPRIFSDWILEKLDINIFQLTFGHIDWYINFKDIFRLLNHDQDSDPRKIYKSPDIDSFLESTAVRKVIFETLLYHYSDELNMMFNEYKEVERRKNDAETFLNNAINRTDIEHENLEKEKELLDQCKTQLDNLLKTRNKHLKDNTVTTAKMNHLSEMESELIDLKIKVSEYSLRKNNLEIEKNNVKKLLSSQNDEILQLEKIIFTHDKLDLFALEICPFCMQETEKREGFCICGSKIEEVEYEKFVYKSSEYKEILDHKKKSIKSIVMALESYDSEISDIVENINKAREQITYLELNLEKIIKTVTFSGNSQLIDEINDKIVVVNNEIQEREQIVSILEEIDMLKSDFTTQNEDFKKKKKDYEACLKKYKRDNATILAEFNSIYAKLLSESSCKSDYAEVNDDYMPYIDKGKYREKSAIVPIRLMYYFTLLSLGLKRQSIKHPRFLLIDTPEEAGIDKSNLKLNLKLLDKAIKMSKKQESEIKEDFQVILTTGEEKYPDEYEEFVKLRFNKKEGRFILKAKNK